MPVHGGVLGQLVGDEDAHLVALDRLDGRAGRLAVVAPQMRLHAGRDLAHDRLGDEMELLPVAVHAPRQGPAVERDDGLVVRPARRVRAAAASWSAPWSAPRAWLRPARARSRPSRRRARPPPKIFCAKSCLCSSFSVPARPSAAAEMRRVRSPPAQPPPSTAASRSHCASQKSRLASTPPWSRDALARLGQQREHVDQHRVVAKQFEDASLQRHADRRVLAAGRGPPTDRA